MRRTAVWAILPLSWTFLSICWTTASSDPVGMFFHYAGSVQVTVDVEFFKSIVFWSLLLAPVAVALYLALFEHVRARIVALSTAALLSNLFMRVVGTWAGLVIGWTFAWDDPAAVYFYYAAPLGVTMDVKFFESIVFWSFLLAPIAVALHLVLLEHIRLRIATLSTAAVLAILLVGRMYAVGKDWEHYPPSLGQIAEGVVAAAPLTITIAILTTIAGWLVVWTIRKLGMGPSRWRNCMPRQDAALR